LNPSREGEEEEEEEIRRDDISVIMGDKDFESK